MEDKTTPVDKNIKDYLFLYLGCEVVCVKSNYYLIHEKFIHKGDTVKVTGWLIDYLIIRDSNDIEVIFKPILRDLSDMTEEEAIEIAKIAASRPPHFNIDDADITRNDNAIEVVFVDKLDEVINIGFSGDVLVYIHADENHRFIERRNNGQPIYLKYLLSKHFDLFNLIPDGLAIDKNKIENHGR